MNNTDLEKKIEKLVHENARNKGDVWVIDILIQLSYLSKKDLDEWRFGRIPYLEKACMVNLSKLTLINKSVSKYATELNLKSSRTGYNKHGKGPKKRLQFSKSGNQTIEDRYATHYIDVNRKLILKKPQTPQTPV